MELTLTGGGGVKTRHPLHLFLVWECNTKNPNLKILQSPPLSPHASSCRHIPHHHREPLSPHCCYFCCWWRWRPTFEHHDSGESKDFNIVVVSIVFSDGHDHNVFAAIALFFPPLSFRAAGSPSLSSLIRLLLLLHHSPPQKRKLWVIVCFCFTCMCVFCHIATRRVCCVGRKMRRTTMKGNHGGCRLASIFCHYQPPCEVAMCV